MPESRAAKGTRLARHLLIRIGLEIRAARMAAGLTVRQAGAAISVSPSEVSRIERGLAPWVALPTLCRLSSVVGLDLWVRTYPGGEPLRDAAHLALLESFRAILGSGLRIRAEVPIGDPRDLRAWDVVISESPGIDCGVELDTRLLDAQDQLRRVTRKRRDSGIDRVLIVLADTRANRAALRAATGLLAAEFSFDEHEIRTSLAAGRIPPRNGVLLLPIVSRREVGRTSRRRPSREAAPND
jgi:transcriptional regulator with XRE-family HTH domain